MRLALGYKARVGKDTVADYIKTRYADSQVIRFAGPIYELHNQIHEFLGLELLKDRALLQILGDWARGKDEKIWIKKALSNVTDRSVIVDVRTTKEALAAKEAGFTLVRIDRPLENRVLDNNMSHFTETELDGFNDWEYVIENDGSFEELYAKVDCLLHMCE